MDRSSYRDAWRHLKICLDRRMTARILTFCWSTSRFQVQIWTKRTASLPMLYRKCFFRKCFVAGPNIVFFPVYFDKQVFLCKMSPLGSTYHPLKFILTYSSPSDCFQGTCRFHAWQCRPDFVFDWVPRYCSHLGSSAEQHSSINEKVISLWSISKLRFDNIQKHPQLCSSGPRSNGNLTPTDLTFSPQKSFSLLLYIGYNAFWQKQVKVIGPFKLY